MDASMIERVARALAECDGCEDWDRLPEDSQRMGIMTKADCRERARAAIEAMREPTWAMTNECVQAQIEVDSEDGASMDNFGAADLWKRMINVALKEEE